MSLPTLLLLVLVAGIGFIPVWLLRRQGEGRAQDYLVASQHARPEVVRNASVAYALRTVAFGALLLCGAAGESWPAIIASASFGLGVYLIFILRQPLLAFVDDALRRDESMTVHAFIARQHGDDRRVRVLAASLTVVTLAGLCIGEALALAAFLEPMLRGDALAVYSLIAATLLVAALFAMLSGNSGAMHSAQLQLGVLYLGLFGATALFLYLHVSALTPLHPQGALAVLFIAAYSLVLLYYRRTRYVDTDPITTAASHRQSRRKALGTRLLSRFAKILNTLLSVLLILIVVMAVMDFFAAGWSSIMRGSAAALQTGTRAPGVALLALCLMPLLYPLVDVVHWQRLAATRKDVDWNAARGIDDAAALRRIFRLYAIESALTGLFICMLGAIAVMSIETARGTGGVANFVAQLASGEGGVPPFALPLLLLCVLAAALSTMSAMFSASLCTIRYDMLGAVWPKLQPGQERTAGDATEATARRHTLAAGSGLLFAVAAGFVLADAFFRISVTSSTFIAVLFAIGCLQLSFVPLVLGPIVAQRRGGVGAVTPGWALFILGFGVAVVVAAVMLYLVTAADAWLWAAVPACVGSGMLLFAIARAASRPSA